MQTRFVEAELFVEYLDRDLAAEFFIFGQINLAHPARADLPDNFVMTKTLSFFNFFGFDFKGIGNFGDGGSLEKALSTVK
ncbi:MAG: hypothetical protein ABIP78_09425 [Pyrinomonadaceae bacterium]